MIGMRAAIKLGLVTFVAAAAIGGEPQLRRDGSFWVEVEKGSEQVSPRSNIRVSTIGNVTVKGINGRQFSYVLVKRVKAVSEDEARRLLTVDDLLQASVKEGILHIELVYRPVS